ncbi:MAG TPA: D-aminoacyl-tRNA deacylase [Chloroflexota bacterium]|nr:D-aminoacyl-tRNA deacylase [Chloroflexota bacterium]
MRAILQRVSQAEVAVDANVVGRIGYGWLVLLGVGHGDTEAEAAKLADKVVRLRAFNDDEGKFNRSALDIGAEVLVVSQFTLYADTSRGRRASFVGAADPSVAVGLVDRFAEIVASYGLKVQTGQFGAHMEVKLVNDGPVTISLEV